MKIKSNNVVENPNVKIYEYPELGENLGSAYAIINGEYPGNGKWARNRKCDMWYLCCSGKGTVEFKDGRTFPLEKRIIIYIPKDTWYRVYGEELKIWVLTQPPWNKDQYEIR